MDYSVVLQCRITQYDLVNIQVTDCRYKRTYLRVTMFATVRTPAPFFFGGGGVKKYFIFFVSE